MIMITSGVKQILALREPFFTVELMVPVSLKLFHMFTAAELRTFLAAVPQFIKSSQLRKNLITFSYLNKDVNSKWSIQSEV